MEFLKKIKDSLFANNIPNPLGIPEPGLLTTLLVGTPESIIKQHLSMQEKTKSYFDYARETGSLTDYCDAVMRYASYSSASIFGINLFIVNNMLGVDKIVPEKMNRLVYGKFLLDIADFSWVMLLYTLDKHRFSENFEKDKLIAYMSADQTAELYWLLVFNYVVGQQNVDFALEMFKGTIQKIEAAEPDKLENRPSAETEKAFADMLEMSVIGDPNEFRLFDTKSMLTVMGSGPLEIHKQVVQFENSQIAKLLIPEVKLHLLSNY